MNLEGTISPAALARVRDELRTRVPKAVAFAASVGLNRTADEIQVQIRASLGRGRFIVRRRAWLEQTIYRDPKQDFARYDRLVAGVRIHPERDVLAKFEAGGRKQPLDGKALAVPVGVRPTPETIVPRRLSVRSLFETARVFARGSAVYRILGRGRGRHLQLAYVFERAVPIPASLGFVRTGRLVAAARALPNIMGAIRQHLTQGLQVGPPKGA